MAGETVRLSGCLQSNERTPVQRVNNEIEDTLLLVEHSPVYTVGWRRHEQSLERERPAEL